MHTVRANRHTSYLKMKKNIGRTALELTVDDKNQWYFKKKEINTTK